MAHLLLSTISYGIRLPSARSRMNGLRSTVALPSFQQLSDLSVRVESLPRTRSISIPPICSSREDNSDFHYRVQHALMVLEAQVSTTLLFRSEHPHYPMIYDENSYLADGFDGCYVEHRMREVENSLPMKAKYAADQLQFFPLTRLDSSITDSEELHAACASINKKKQVWDIYVDNLIPRLAKEGEDASSSSYNICVTLDRECLLAISKMIHYAMFGAESTYRQDPKLFAPPIRAKDSKQLINLLTNKEADKMVFERVESMMAAATPSQNRPGVNRLPPSLVAELIVTWIIPLAKEVQVDYLLKRLD